jgi:hypothetical protein
MHVGVARADELVRGGERRLAGHQQHGQPAAEDVVHGGRRVGGADVDMHQHALAASGHQRVAGRHVRRGVLVRAADRLRHRLAALLAVGQLLDDRRMVGAEIAKEIVDADLVEAFQQEIGGRMGLRIGCRACVHGGVRG